MGMSKRIFFVCLLVVALASSPARAQTVKGELATKVDEYLRRLEPFGFSGAALLAKDGGIVLEKGYGWANREKKIPFTADTVSSIGSITKQFTGAAILKLEMMGKLRTDDPISKYLPNVPTDKAGITIHHLLTHTSGIATVPGGDDDPITRDELVQQALALPLVSQPGARFRYLNEGFSLAAAIVELVSGKSYEEFLRENFFKPAGMNSTGYVLPKWAPERLAHGYNEQGHDMGTFESRNWGPNGPGWHLVGNGGILSTPGDMYRWHLALMGDKILSNEAKEKYYKPYIRTDGSDFYGYGWGVMTTPRNTKLIAHNGGNGIFFSDFRRYVDEGIVIFAFSNGEVRATVLGNNQLPALVFGQNVPMPPHVTQLQPAALAKLAGTYSTDAGERIEVSERNGRLVLASGDKRLLAVLGGLVPAGSPQFAPFEEHTKRVLESAAKGDYAAVHEAFGRRMPLKRVEEQEGNLWRELREENGEFTGVEILGSSRQGPAARVVARLNFERGSASLVYAWDGEQVMGIQVMGQPPGSTFFPQSATEFVRFSLRDPQPLVIRFETGAATKVVLPSPAGEIRATKTL
jgi:CubicO group peptidase (beta-lactamase class C family)